MLPKRASWLNALVSKWETRASLFQFLAKDVWELPFVKPALAAMTALTTGALTLPAETQRYAVAVLVTVAMYALIWFRLNLRPMVDLAATRAADLVTQNAFAPPADDEATRERKKLLAAFVRGDYIPARKAAMELEKTLYEIRYPSSKADPIATTKQNSARSKEMRELESQYSDSKSSYISIHSMQDRTSYLLNRYNDNTMDIISSLKDRDYKFDDANYVRWVADDHSMLRRLRLLLRDNRYPDLSHDLGDSWGVEERRWCPKYPSDIP